MLHTIFNSARKIRILQILFSHPDEIFTPTSLAKLTRIPSGETHRLLKPLRTSGVVNAVYLSHKKRKTTGYQINQAHILYSELRALFVKSQLFVEGTLIKSMQKLSNASLVILTGIFTSGFHHAPTDILIVGSVSKKKISSLVRTYETRTRLEVRYTIMTRGEYRYRKNIADRFLNSILESEKIIILDTLHDSYSQ